MPTITTKSQVKTRAQKPSEEEIASASGSSSEASSESSSSGSGTSPETWTQNEDGTFKGSGGGKHWGDRHPKVAVGTKAEAEALIREVDPTAKISGSVVKSQRDTLDTYLVEVRGRWIISGPLARVVGQVRGLMELTSGDGNPLIVAPAAEGASNETGTG